MYTIIHCDAESKLEMLMKNQPYEHLF